MKKFYYLMSAVSLVALTFASCKKEEEKTVSEKINGHWTIDKQYLQSSLVASADGSYLEFNSNGNGIDHKGSDNTTGTITWALQNEDSQVLFADTTNNGGYWNGAYDIVSITETKLVIKAGTILGEYKCELSK